MCCARLLGQHGTSTSGSSSPGAPADGHTSTLRKACSSCGLTTAQACRELSTAGRKFVPGYVLADFTSCSKRGASLCSSCSTV